MQSITLTSSVSLSIALAAVLSATTAVAQAPRDGSPRDSRPRSSSPSSQREAQSGGQRNQPGLGGGTALDRNLQRGSGGVNPRAAGPDFAGRNLLVTDSVAGGRGFRGSVGYTAAEDFRGATAGDSSFAFRSNSALSSPALASLRAQDRFTLAQDFGRYEFRRDATPVSSSADRVRLDRSAAAISSGRAFELDAEPSAFARGQDQAQRNVEFLVSPIQGMRVRRVDDPLEQAGLGTYEKARARRDVSLGQVDPKRPAAQFESLLFDSLRNETERRDGRLNASDERGSSYDEIVKRIVERYDDDPTVNIDANPKALDRARAELRRVRDALTGATLRSEKRGGDNSIDSAIIDPITGLPKKRSTTPDAGSDATVTPADETPEQAEQRKIDDARKTVGAAADALKHGTTIKDLSPGDRARVDELVREGQQQLAISEFFRAERCFDQALELNPDNPLLFAGLAHSQIGAGLHLSAALTLRTLFSNHPEMIDTLYERVLLPNETRMRLAVEGLRKRLAVGQDADGYGLTLAYLGHQLGDKELVREGLASVKGTIENDLLKELLTQIWLSEKPAEKTPESPETPAPGAGSSPATSPPSGTDK